MLVFISDLHFTDGTAGKHNINPKAFDYFFEDLNSIIKDERNAIQEVIVVFLGDIFDLLRTWYWVDGGCPVDEKPWGKKEKDEALRRHSETIFDDITENGDNELSLEKIRNGLADIQKNFPGLPLDSLYFPGNHDRLVNQYRSLREKVCKSLGLNHDADSMFPHSKIFPEYGVIARHGHEFDSYNYEGGSTFSEDDYQKVPIGDPITTELVSRLPFEIKNRLDRETTYTQAEKDTLIRNFQEIDNVRPFGAVIEWLLYQVKGKPPRLIDLINDAVDFVIRDFNRLEFVQAWFEGHDKWLDPFDKADQIQIALYILEKFNIFSLEKLFSLVTKAGALKFSDPLLEAAPDENALLDPRIRYVVYGHTHEPLVVPLRVRGDREQVYLNTGTWRMRYQKAVRDNSFIGWKNMTYVVFYRDNERPGREADFETWTGTLK
jgi:UDP-2,3-diacylglucosamine pyrophosphatase LpxH